MGSLRHILLVERNQRDVQSTLKTLAEYRLANQVDVVRDGEEAVEYLLKKGPYHLRSSGIPALIFFDFSSLISAAPATFAALSKDSRLQNIPVVIMVASREERASIEGAGMKNATYVVKPVDVHDVLEAMKSIGGSWAVVLQESAGDRGGVMRRFHNEPQPQRMSELHHGSPDSNTPSRG